jgi:hypothetical protein
MCVELAIKDRNSRVHFINIRMESVGIEQSENRSEDLHEIWREWISRIEDLEAVTGWTHQSCYVVSESYPWP